MMPIAARADGAGERRRGRDGVAQRRECGRRQLRRSARTPRVTRDAAVTVRRRSSERLFLMTAVEVEETLKRIAGHKGVLGTIIVNKEGVVIRTTFDAERAAKTAGALWSNVARAMSSVRELDPTDAAICIRIRTSKLEYMIVPEAEFGLIVLQQPNSEE